MPGTPDPEARWRSIDALFADALELPADRRTAWLAAATGGDAELAAAVERLLAAAEPEEGELLVPGGGLGGPLGDDLAGHLDLPPSLAPGTRIGPYRLVAELGRGGMAVVYRAERVEGGFAQQVALKLLKRGTDTDEVLSRFTQERQILAALEHPAIARLYDGGSTETGQPYLAMELVAGLSIDRYCASRELSLERRLRLFFHVGRAVEHAHHNLVVHRDIKPSNVLVSDDGHVKLLDFGIAKLIDPAPWPGAAPHTRPHLRLLTPEYASPEQIRGEAVTTATDVYQLGLLLYELLTGKRPFELAGCSPTEMEAVICHQPPTAPSTALSYITTRLDNTRTEGLSARDRRRLARRLKGDLDNIVLKALAKEPDRRYVSAGALVDDLERFLDGRPVSARPASFSYRASKFARRHAWGLAASAAALLVAGALTTLYTVRLARERDRAEHQADRAEQVSRFLSSVLGAADPYASSGGPLTARKLLDEGLERVDAELGDQPDLQAATLVRLGEIYRNLGLMEEAHGCFERSLALRLPLYGDQSLEVAESRYFLAASSRARDVRLARQLLESALAVRREKLGPGHPEVGRTLIKLASAARMLGEHEPARRLLEEGRRILEASRGPEHPEVADALVTLSQLQEQLQQTPEALTTMRQALAIRERAFGAESAKVAETLEMLAGLLGSLGDHDLALATTRRARELAAKTLDSAHPLFADLSFEEAQALRHLGRFDEARLRLEEALQYSERTNGPLFLRTLMYLEEKVRLLKWSQRPGEALALSRLYVGRLESIFGPGSPHLADDLIEQADLLRLAGLRQEARATFDRGLALDSHPEPTTRPLTTLQFHARLADDLAHPRAAELQARASRAERAQGPGPAPQGEPPPPAGPGPQLQQ